MFLITVGPIVIKQGDHLRTMYWIFVSKLPSYNSLLKVLDMQTLSILLNCSYKSIFHLQRQWENGKPNVSVIQDMYAR